jgi:carotenoid cleavage dioxygenase-like enzyme
MIRAARFTYLDCFKPDDAGNKVQLYQGLNALARLDYQTGEVEYFVPGPHCLVQEPCFSPRHPDAKEGDGFIITMVDNMKFNRNEVVSFCPPSCARVLSYENFTLADYPRHTGLSIRCCQNHSSVP